MQFRPLVLLILGAVALPAQSASRDPLPLLQTISFDVGAALQERWRLSVEPVVFGRMTLGLTGSLSTRPDREQPDPYVLMARPGGMDLFPCPYPGCTYYPPNPPMKYRATSLGVHLRWYPAALSRDGARQRVAAYIGESLEYQERRITTRTYYPQPMPADSVVYPLPSWAYGETFVQRVHSWEPGLEFGVRLMMGKRVLIDAGSTLRIVRANDPTSRLRPGDTDARFLVAVGIGW